MQVRVYGTAAEIREGDLYGCTAIVIDVLRATSTMLAALENGAAAIYPVCEIEQALALRKEIPDALLCGERGGLAIEGFDLDNSPLHYIKEKVSGRELIMTTTNGTRAIAAASSAHTILLGTLRAASAVAEAAKKPGRDIAIVCAGTGGEFSLDDIYTAGAIVDRLCPDRQNDLARAARAVYKSGPVRQVLGGSLHYEKMVSLGFEGDLQFCLNEDVSGTVPTFQNAKVTRY